MKSGGYVLENYFKVCEYVAIPKLKITLNDLNNHNIKEKVGDKSTRCIFDVLKNYKSVNVDDVTETCVDAYALRYYGYYDYEEHLLYGYIIDPIEYIEYPALSKIKIGLEKETKTNYEDFDEGITDFNEETTEVVNCYPVNL